MKIYCVDLEWDDTTRYIFSTREKAETCIKELGEENYYINEMELDEGPPEEIKQGRKR